MKSGKKFSKSNIFDNEKQFQEWCNNILKKLGVHYLHIPSKNRYIRKGIPDLLCWHKGHSFVVELKLKGNYLSKEQKNEIKNFTKQKIPAYVVYSQEEFLEVLETELTIKNV